MTRRTARAWWLLSGGAVLVLWGWFVLGFLTEPSAVGRVRTLLILIGAGSLVIGLAAGAAGLRMLLTRRT